jgi:penicillin V acylase-like amidase (Ntn superfamily)
MKDPMKRNRLTKALIACICALFISHAPALGCSRIFWNTNALAKVVGRTMDFYMSDQPNLVISPRGLSRNGQVGENSMTWKSKYGSVATTALKLATSDGMNEKGLAVHLLYLHGAEYEPRDKRPGVSNALWGQYFLDNCSSVAEALSRLNDFQIVSVEVTGRQWPVHLAMEDSSGDSAILEYSRGKLVVHHGPQYSVMTNEPLYSEQLENLKKYRLFGGDLPLPGDINPLSRFVRAASFLKTLPEPKNDLEAVAGVLSVTRTVMSPFGAKDTSGGSFVDAWPTLWIAAADITNLIYYFNSTTSPNIYWVDLKKFDLTEGHPVLKLDPNKIDLVGEVSQEFKP